MCSSDVQYSLLSLQLNVHVSLGHSPCRVNDNMHERMGSPKFRATLIFWAAREIWAKQVFKDPKTYFGSRALMADICDLEFIFGVCVLKVILSNNSSLCKVATVRILSDVPFPREGEIY